MHLLKTDNWRSHALRSLCGTVSMFCLFVAIAMIPLADLTAISFTTPLFLTVLAMVFLGERIHRFRWTALGIGFVGVLITIGPHLSFTHGASAGVLVALSSAMFSAFALMFLRKHERRRARDHHHVLLLAHVHGVLRPDGDPRVADADAGQWLLIVGAGLFGVFGQVLMTYSYRYAEASTIAPIDYSNMIMSIVLGYAVLRRNPDAVGVDRRAADSRRRPDHPVARVLPEEAAERAQLAVLRDPAPARSYTRARRATNLTVQCLASPDCDITR